jgi:hypothetical protein
VELLLGNGLPDADDSEEEAAEDVDEEAEVEEDVVLTALQLLGVITKLLI